MTDAPDLVTDADLIHAAASLARHTPEYMRAAHIAPRIEEAA